MNKEKIAEILKSNSDAAAGCEVKYNITHDAIIKTVYDCIDCIDIELTRLTKERDELKAHADRMYLTLQSANILKDIGREDCTYGDTEYDSLSAVYGYNLAVDNVAEIVSPAIIAYTEYLKGGGNGR